MYAIRSYYAPGEAIVVHTAGSMPMQVLSGHATRYGVCYPFQTLTRGVPVNFSEVPLLLEASSDEVLAHIEHLARELSSCVYRITSEQRKLLHLAGIMANNFTNHLMARARITSYNVCYTKLLRIFTSYEQSNRGKAGKQLLHLPIIGQCSILYNLSGIRITSYNVCYTKLLRVREYAPACARFLSAKATARSDQGPAVLDQ